MFLCDNHPARMLSEVSICGGDTTPWAVTILKENGDAYPYAALDAATASLALTPYAISTGLGNNADVVDPVLVKDGTISSSDEGGGIVEFELSSTDTMNLRGKYIYQITISKDGDSRVYQGIVTVKQNINRTTAK
jgi:hypothetical protein